MTDKEKARFKVKFPNVNLSKQRLDALKLNLPDDADETAIDAKLDEVNGYYPYADLAKEDDRLRTPPKPPVTPPAVPPTDPPADPAPGDSMPAWFKTYSEKNDARLAAIENGKTTDTRKTQLETALKDAPEAYRNSIMKAFSRMNFEKDEDFESYKAEVEADLPGIIQTQADNGLRGMNPPAKPGGASTKEASKEEVKAIFNKK